MWWKFIFCCGYYRYEVSAIGWEVGAGEIRMFGCGGYSE